MREKGAGEYGVDPTSGVDREQLAAAVAGTPERAPAAEVVPGADGVDEVRSGLAGAPERAAESEASAESSAKSAVHRQPR
ncbi:hypothetical protein ACMA1D_15680 [Streptomyces sp. 796.1]|uniref:hypothetical protein n=1 Tax=Streptomyces sp. 796.1 TaxID=3163029 RepID=UPI0039C93780